MSRRLSNRWKQGMALLLAVTLVLSSFPAASAAGREGQSTGENQQMTELMEAVYAAMGASADGNGVKLADPSEHLVSPGANGSVPVTTLADTPLRWNLLSRVGGTRLPTIYHADHPEIRVSADGRYVAFKKYDYKPDPLEIKSVIGVYDRLTGMTDNVMGPGNVQTDQMLNFDMSDDARYVAYSFETNLMDRLAQVYLFDRETRNQTVITPVGGESWDDNSNRVSISADGRYVAFDSASPGLVPEDDDDIRDVFVYDQDNGSIQRISTRAGMEDYDYGDSLAASISGDGRYIAFQSEARLVDDDFNYQSDIYVYDRENAAAPLQRISVGMNGEEADYRSGDPSISADGQVIAFESEASNLVAGDTNEVKDIFVRDRRTASTVRVSLGAGGIQLARESERPIISDDGSYVGFQLAYQWVEDTDDDHDNDEENDLPEEAYVADVALQTAVPVTVPSSPHRLVNPSQRPFVGGGGALVAYFSNYMDTFGTEEEFELPGIFIAAKGEAPVWPAGSKLEPSERTDESVKLSWQDATGAGGILGYHVYQDGTIIGYVPYSGAGGSYTATGLLPDAGHVFQVEAVNAGYHESFGGPTHKLGSGGENPGGQLRVTWETDDMRHGLLLAGSELVFTAYGDPGKQASAELTYLVRKGDSAPEARRAVLPMREIETTPGMYRITYKMEEGTSELTSLNVKLTDPAKPGEVTEKQAGGFPLQVAGSLTIGFDNPGGASLSGGILSVISSQYGQQVSVLSGSDPVTIRGIVPGKDYTVVLRSGDYRYVWAKQEQVRAEAGRTQAITMPIVQPAKARFQIVDPTGLPISGVRVELFDAEQNYIGSDSSGMDGWTNWEENLQAGEKLTAKVDIGDRLMELVPNQEVQLLPGANEIIVKLKAAGEGLLEGIVKSPDGQPVRNALVTSTQTYRGQQVVRSARTNLEGAYRLSLLKGEAQLEASEGSYQYSTETPLQVQIAEGQTTKLDIPVKQPGRGVVNLEVYLKYIDSEWIGPVNLEQMGFLTRVTSKYGWMTGYFHNAYHFQGSPNDTVSVCVTATVPAYMTVCQDVTLDASANGTAKLYVEEKGGRIQGKLAITDQRWISGRLYKVNDNGYKISSGYLGDDDFSGGAFDINVPEPGTYVMELTRQLQGAQTKYEYASVQFTVAEQQIMQLGTIGFSGRSYFSAYDGNYFAVSPNRITPGSMVSFRVGYKNGSPSAAEQASLMIDIPEGLTPLADAGGRIVVSGDAAGEAKLEGRTVIVPLGTIASKKSGTISLQAKVDPAFNMSKVNTSARIRADIGGELVEETIGSVQLDAPMVTIDAPERVYAKEIALSGLAPAGSAVKVYDGKALLGGATASPAGTWSLKTELPELGDPGMHALRAETEAGGAKLQSEVAYVSYDTKKPRLLEVAMAQAPSGKWVTMDTRLGVSRLPYTVVPGNPFQFELKFDRPDDVENVYVYLEGQSGEPVKAVRDGGLFRAIAPTDKGALGDIYVDFDTKPEPFAFDVSDIPALGEMRESLPPAMRDFELEVTSPFELKNGKSSGTVRLTFPQLEDMTMTVTLTLEPNANYSATPEELELARRSGSPLLSGTVGLTETEDGFKTIAKGYVPATVLFPDGWPAGLKTLQASGEAGAFAPDPTFVAVTTETYTQFGPNGSEFGTFNSIKNQYDGMQGFAEKINKITYKVQASGLDCLAELPRTVKQAGKALVAVVGGEVAKFGLGVWTAAMGLSGAGAVAAAGTSAVVGAKIDSYVDEQIDAVGTGYNQCLNEDVDKEKRKRWKIAKLRWIYDPSGYVYEAVPGNRLSGVQATVLYQDPDSGEWSVWDAGPYEQINPHDTNEEGKYGWDVPPGKWKVVWEKAGYETASSAELDVPPPHTEVNAGLVSREAPKVQSVQGFTSVGGSYTEVLLTKHVKVSELPAAAVTVMDPEGRPLEGTLSFEKAEANPAGPEGEMLSRIVRFTPKSGTLAAGLGYRVKVNAGYFQSYAGVWMNEGHSGLFTVNVRDEQGPSAVGATVEGEGMIVRVTFDEPLEASADVEKLVWNGSGEAIASTVRSVVEGEENTILISLKEPLAAGETGELRLLAGVVSDMAGNGSKEKTLIVSRQMVSNDASLSGLSIEEVGLTPDFDPERLSYTAEVPSSAEQVRILAVTSDPQAKLVVEGIEALSGAATAAAIPMDGSVDVRVIAADGKTVRDYTIQVSRKPDPVSSDATLSALTVSPGTLTPVFDPAKDAYSVLVEKNATTLQVTATKKDPKAKSLTINGEAAVSGTAKAVAIPASGLITIAVTAEDGTTLRSYTIQVNRKPDPVSSDATLSALAVSPG
ncbi:cadherin-like beta sandwich domain-containing protein, partial [Paenibacillus mendelii]